MERDLVPLLDCMVSYFGLDENEEPGLRRYFCYHVLAGPGPEAGTGVAVIQTLAVFNEAERCDRCQHFHMVRSGGPRAALIQTIRYLDAYHQGDHVRKVQSGVRPGDQADATLPAQALRPSRKSGAFVREG